MPSPQKKQPGPEPQRLKVDGDWERAVGQSIRAGKPTDEKKRVPKKSAKKKPK